MMLTARWSFLLVAFAVLTSSATAHAECAWVLWVRAAVADGKGAPAGPWTEWTTFGSVNVQRGCEALYPIAEEKKQEAVWATGLKSPNTRVTVRWQCLPDTVDPRGPKGK